MTINKNEFKHDSTQNSKTIVDFINSLNGGFLNGQLVLESKKNRIALNPQGLINFKVKAKIKDESGSITLMFDWKEKE